MRKALALAGKGRGTTSPNPMVGAVIVREGRLLGAGWHQRAGGPHAEINAFRSLADPEQARGATLYVTLEPCSTTGRTPPCCDAIIRHGIRRVVAGCTDPNPKHAGNGFELLRKQGIEVVQGVCEKACRELNEAFFHWIVTGRPFVLLKLAETLDGRIATASGSSQWITGAAARKHVMELRLLADAVMTGAQTFRTDAPSLTARKQDGTVLKTPRRIVLTRDPERLHLPPGWETAALPSREAWKNYLEKLGREQVTFLLLEGGGELAASALHAGAVDKVEFHIAPKILGGRGSRPSVGGEDPASIDNALKLENVRCRKLGEDFILSGVPAERKGS